MPNQIAYCKIIARTIGLYLCIFAIGSCLTLAFAPFNIRWLGIVCPSVLLIFWQGISPKHAFIRGACFGAGFFTSGLSWVYISLHNYGQASPIVAGLLTALMIVVLSTYIALTGYLLNRFFPFPTVTTYRFLLAFPSLWVLNEYARCWVLTGFPWLFLGYSQLNLPLSGFAPIFSVFGVSWAVAATAGAMVLFYLLIKQRLIVTSFLLKNALHPVLPVIQVKSGIFAICLILSLWVSGELLTTIVWTKPNGKLISVTLVQGDIAPALKWIPEQAQHALSIYSQLTAPYWQNSDLILWPEAAITYFQHQIPTYLNALNITGKRHHTTLILGIPTQNQSFTYNSMLALGEGHGVYYKRHLVPFGEFIPFRAWLHWLENYVQIPMSDFDAGERYQSLLQADHIPLATFICYEIAYPDEVLDALPAGEMILTISDDSWFGKSIAPAQHLQIAQMRALETGRYLLMDTNDGITAIIDAKGNIKAQSPRYIATVLTGQVQPMLGSTPLVHLGVYPLFWWIIVVIVIGSIRLRLRSMDLV